MMENIMEMVYEHLSPAEIDAYHKEIVCLPDVLLTYEDDTLEGITVAREKSGKQGLLIATSIRIAYVQSFWRYASEIWDALYIEIEAANYCDGWLNFKKDRGWKKTLKVELCSEKPSEQFIFINVLRQQIPWFVDAYQPDELSREVELAGDNMVSEEKAFAIDHALRSLSIVEATDLSRGEIKELPNILWEDELPEAIISGTYHNGEGLLVATDRRLIFIDKGLIGLTVEDFYFEDISSIETHQGWMLGSLNIYARGNKERIDNVYKDVVRPFADFLRNKLAIAKQLKQEQQNSPVVVQSNVSVADELKKFAELRDLGVITDEEFEAQKSKLLGMG